MIPQPTTTQAQINNTHTSTPLLDDYLKDLGCNDYEIQEMKQNTLQETTKKQMIPQPATTEVQINNTHTPTSLLDNYLKNLNDESDKILQSIKKNGSNTPNVSMDNHYKTEQTTLQPRFKEGVPNNLLSNILDNYSKNLEDECEKILRSIGENSSNQPRIIPQRGKTQQSFTPSVSMDNYYKTGGYNAVSKNTFTNAEQAIHKMENEIDKLPTFIKTHYVKTGKKPKIKEFEDYLESKRQEIEQKFNVNIQIIKSEAEPDMHSKDIKRKINFSFNIKPTSIETANTH
jgi:hypothetical protein